MRDHAVLMGGPRHGDVVRLHIPARYVLMESPRKYGKYRLFDRKGNKWRYRFVTERK